MSLVMAEYEEQEYRGYRRIENKFVCPTCFTDKPIQQEILRRAKSRVCSYCGKTATKAFAAPMDKIQEFIMDAIRYEWGDPQDEGGIWDSEDKKWIVTEAIDYWELFLHPDIMPTESDEVLNDLHDSLLDREWSVAANSTKEAGQSLAYSWQHFSYHVKHAARYVFYHKFSHQAHFEDHDIIPVSRMLGAIQSLIRRSKIIEAIHADSELFRVRIAHPFKHFTKACDLGPPSIEDCKYPNRMSPAGIPMFYGAFDGTTALAETVAPSAFRFKVATFGVFKSLRKLRVINFAKLPEVPSIYDKKQRASRAAILFLHKFAAEISRSIVKDGREHIEYVPTQVFAEYLRYIFRDKSGMRLDGIIFSSSKQKGGWSIVLFLDSDDCCDKAFDDKAHRTLVLERYFRQQIFSINLRYAFKWFYSVRSLFYQLMKPKTYHKKR